MPWYKRESTPQEERKLRIFFAVLFGVVALATLMAAVQDFSDGKGWVGGRRLVGAFLFGLLAAKGPELWSRGTLGIKLLAVGAFLLYAVLYTLQVIVPFAR